MKIWLVAFTYISTSSKENVDTNSKNNMEEQIEESLALKYAEPFKVIDQYFDKSLNVYTFTASPKANDDIVFEGNYDERESNEQKKFSMMVILILNTPTKPEFISNLSFQIRS